MCLHGKPAWPRLADGDLAGIRVNLVLLVDAHGVFVCPGLGFGFGAEALLGTATPIGGAVLDSSCVPAGCLIFLYGCHKGLSCLYSVG